MTSDSNSMEVGKWSIGSEVIAWDTFRELGVILASMLSRGNDQAKKISSVFVSRS